MKNIFIDTSVFEANNFFEGSKIKGILQLARKGHVQIVLPQLIIDEIKNRMKIKSLESLNRISKFYKDIKVLRNSDKCDQLFNDAPDFNDVEKTIKSRIELELYSDGVHRIDYSSMNVHDVFDKYFNSKYPFDKGKKKNEFPDAFALKILEDWCKTENTKCIILSLDNDIKNYKCTEFEVIDNYSDFLASQQQEFVTSLERKRVNLLQKEYLATKHVYEGKIKNVVNNILDDDTIYYEYTNYLDLHNLTINSINVSLNELIVTNVSDEEILFQVDADIDYCLTLTFDDEEDAYYDKEDDVWHYFDSVSKTIKKETRILLDFSSEVFVKESEDISEKIDFEEGAEIYMEEDIDFEI